MIAREPVLHHEFHIRPALVLQEGRQARRRLLQGADRGDILRGQPQAPPREAGGFGGQSLDEPELTPHGHRHWWVVGRPVGLAGPGASPAIPASPAESGGPGSAFASGLWRAGVPATPSAVAGESLPPRHRGIVGSTQTTRRAAPAWPGSSHRPPRPPPGAVAAGADWSTAHPRPRAPANAAATARG